MNAGEDTTSHLITICLYLLIEHPEIKERIRAEMKENIQDIAHPKFDEIKKYEIFGCILTRNTKIL